MLTPNKSILEAGIGATWAGPSGLKDKPLQGERIWSFVPEFWLQAAYQQHFYVA
jgi:hypothetical protein